ncbi:MAG: hypothetical protein ACK5QC_06000 [Bacteroidota bacterium]|jgi:hypothetical protein|nr:hypothetical protein [Bacteroidota bacterium]MCA6445000.1 hypothetical protein [Bacteroidota bacterium]
MRHKYFITIILVSTNFILKSQSAKSDSLLLFEKLVFNAKSKITSDSLLHEKLNFAIRNADLVSAYNTYLRLEKGGYRVYNKNYYWNSALLCLDNFNFSSAIQNYKLYRLNFDSLSIHSNLLGYLVHVNYDSIIAKKYYKKMIELDSTLSCMSCFYDLLNKKVKSGTGYMISSGVIPGSGLVAIGKPLKGIASIVLIGGMSYGVYSLIQSNMYINAINWSLNLGMKFYLGQIKLTKKEFDKKQNKKRSILNKKCKANYLEVLTKYNLTYKVSSLP